MSSLVKCCFIVSSNFCLYQLSNDSLLALKCVLTICQFYEIKNKQKALEKHNIIEKCEMFLITMFSEIDKHLTLTVVLKLAIKIPEPDSRQHFNLR